MVTGPAGRVDLILLGDPVPHLKHLPGGLELRLVFLLHRVFHVAMRALHAQHAIEHVHHHRNAFRRHPLQDLQILVLGRLRQRRGGECENQPTDFHLRSIPASRAPVPPFVTNSPPAVTNPHATLSEMTPFRLDGRVALVTGGSSGIGEAVARAFTAARASVIIMSIDPERAATISAQLPGSRVLLSDVTHEPALNVAFATLGHLDILVNNAGIGLVGNIEETSLDDFRRLFRTNVEGVFLVTKAAIPLLRKSHGSIINIGSVPGLVGVKRRAAYFGTKGAVIALTPQLTVS